MRHNENNKKSINQALGLHIRHRREELQLTRDNIAEKTGLSINSIENIENGKTKGEAKMYFSTLMQICRSLGMEANELQDIYNDFQDNKEQE